VRVVRTERAQPTGVGTAAGAVVGGVAGSTVGGGRGSIVGAVVGAVIGGVAGSHIEKNTSDRPGLEITVRTDDGRTLAIVQEADGQRLEPGQRVRLLTDPRGQVRVSAY
jgi:outer membrane lipoprotein SlyB